MSTREDTLLEIIQQLQLQNKKQQEQSQRQQEQSQRQQEQYQEQNQKLTEIIEQLSAEIAELKMLLFGQKSERKNTKRIPSPRPKQKSDPKETQQKRKKKREQKQNLPVEIVELKPSVEELSCCCCSPGDFSCIGTKSSEVFEYIPSVLRRFRYNRKTMKCRCGKTIVTASAPSNVSDGLRYGPGFHAHVVVSKVDDALPLERQSKILERQGVEINKSSLCDIFHRSAELLSPIYNCMVEKISNSEIVNADETPIKLQHPKKCKTAYMWTFLDKEQMVYSFSTSRSGKTPQKILGKSDGILQVDGYSGYNKVTSPESRTRAGCPTFLPLEELSPFHRFALQEGLIYGDIFLERWIPIPNQNALSI